METWSEREEDEGVREDEEGWGRAMRSSRRVVVTRWGGVGWGERWSAVLHDPHLTSGRGKKQKSGKKMEKETMEEADAHKHTHTHAHTHTLKHIQTLKHTDTCTQ